VPVVDHGFVLEMAEGRGGEHSPVLVCVMLGSRSIRQARAYACFTTSLSLCHCSVTLYLVSVDSPD